jgi:hypothetical protein
LNYRLKYVESLYLGVNRQAEKIKKTERTRKWWFDFEEMGNAFVIPETTKKYFLVGE